MVREAIAGLAVEVARDALTAQTQEALEDIAASAFCQRIGQENHYQDDIACFYVSFTMAMIALGKAPFLLDLMSRWP